MNLQQRKKFRSRLLNDGSLWKNVWLEMFLFNKQNTPVGTVSPVFFLFSRAENVNILT